MILRKYFICVLNVSQFYFMLETFQPALYPKVTYSAQPSTV